MKSLSLLRPFFHPQSCRWLTVAPLLLAAACTAPRAIVATGKVTPQGEFRVAYNQGFNIATAPIGKAGAAVRDAASNLANKDTVGYNNSLTGLQAAAIAYLLDPVQPTADFSLRYGIVPHLDAGYKYAFGSHVFDAQYQFMGPVGTPENPGAGAVSGTTYGSVGVQFATQRAKLPSLPFLTDINNVLNFSASRNDLLIPLIFSQSFGPEEEIGAISYGVIYGHSWVTYGFAPTNIYQQQPTAARPAHAVAQFLVVRRLRQFENRVSLRLLRPGAVHLLPELWRLCPAQRSQHLAERGHLCAQPGVAGADSDEVRREQRCLRTRKKALPQCDRAFPNVGDAEARFA